MESKKTKHSILISVVIGCTLFLMLLVVFKQMSVFAYVLTPTSTSFFRGGEAPIINCDQDGFRLAYYKNSDLSAPLALSNCNDPLSSQTALESFDQVLNIPAPDIFKIVYTTTDTCWNSQMSFDDCLSLQGVGQLDINYFSEVVTGTINVVKTVVNDNGGTKVVADFPLFVNGSPVVSGITNTFPAAASYSVTETSDANYTQVFSGDCGINGNINLISGDNKFCIITNDDIAPVAPAPSGGGGGGSSLPPPAPLIDVVKVPNPLALPGGPGPVTYTYTLSNIGIVSVADITMVGDTCSPIVLTSGDTFGDSILDINEIWTYTCTSTLTETHTNTVVATGWANGISAVDIASSTVVVGAPGLPDTGSDSEVTPLLINIVPPLIHIVKTPSAFILPISGPVTYTFVVTNPGTVSLRNVVVNDNKCSPTQAHTGDVNNNNMLDVSETWVYSCQTNLTSNTVNTATATGMASGLTATDFSVVTVLVTSPMFPATGIAPGK